MAALIHITPNGNLRSDFTSVFVWNVRDLFTSMNGDGATSNYIYDAFNRCVSCTLNDSQVAYVRDSCDPVHTGIALNGASLRESYARNVGSALLSNALRSTTPRVGRTQ